MSQPPRITADWLTAQPLETVFEALGGQAYLVGGCVRNALLGLEVADVDLATPLPPGQVVDLLETAGVRAVPTGFEHGTVTAVLNGQGYEITTFRADVETDGRHAVVRFSTDIAEDACRRDFTINALYATADGTVIDPLNSLQDLILRRVRFIGEARDRLREDFLRILRFFRFTAWYAEGGRPDAEGLAACEAEVAGLSGIARERVGAEMRKLLGAPDPAAALAAMEACGVLAEVLPGASAAKVPALLRLEAGLRAAPDWVRRLVVLTDGEAAPVDALKLSREDARRFRDIASVAAASDPPALAAETAGAKAALSGLLVSAARHGGALVDGFEAEIARGAAAQLPLRAEDLMAAGWTQGPGLGAALAEARSLWRKSDFTLDKNALLGHLGKKVS
ncbi:MAG: CCA tRNA nucleotidyltransferase [Pseudomonadota bacterium]